MASDYILDHQRRSAEQPSQSPFDKVIMTKETDD